MEGWVGLSIAGGATLWGQERLACGTLLQCGCVSGWPFPTVLPRVATGWAVPSLYPHLNMVGR